MRFFKAASKLLSTLSRDNTFVIVIVLYSKLQILPAAVKAFVEAVVIVVVVNSKKLLFNTLSLVNGVRKKVKN
jgi:hypothetical protein